MPNLPLCIATNTLRLIVVVTHAVGTRLLIMVYKQSGPQPEQLLLINLSFSEIIFTIFDMLRTPVSDFLISYVRTNATIGTNATSVAVSQGYLAPHVLTTIQDVQDYITITGGYCVILTWYLSMFYLTLDRLLDIVLGIRYHLYCDTEKANFLLKVTWALTVILAFLMCLVNGFSTFGSIDFLLKYVYPSFDFAFILLAFTTYGFLFHKYRLSRIPPATDPLIASSKRVESSVAVTTSPSKSTKSMRKSIRRPESVISTFKGSRFHVPACLIATFLVFITVPDLMFSFGFASYEKSENTREHSVIDEMCYMSIVIGCLSDAAIYIFLSPSVKRMLMRKLRVRRQSSVNRRNNKHLCSCISKEDV